LTNKEPLPTMNDEEKLKDFIDKHGEEKFTLYTVHAVSGWDKTDQQRFDSWTLLRQTPDGEEDEIMHRTPEANGDKPGKELIKDEARKLARENRPAIVNIENRDFETHRIEVAE